MGFPSARARDLAGAEFRASEVFFAPRISPKRMLRFASAAAEIQGAGLLEGPRSARKNKKGDTLDLSLRHRPRKGGRKG